MKALNIKYYEALVEDLETIEKLNRDIRRHFPDLALPAIQINVRVNKARGRLVKQIERITKK